MFIYSIVCIQPISLTVAPLHACQVEAVHVSKNDSDSEHVRYMYMLVNMYSPTK